MDRRRLISGGALGLVALGGCLARINAHGLWFDEAYTARIASLAPDRVLRGALADIHPPGWPLLSALMLRLPLPSEVALRLPSTLAFTLLVGWLGSRHPLLGLAALLAAPLVDQATQGRPYMLLAAGLVLCSALLARGRWGSGGLVAGAVASLHALGGALVAPVVLVHAILGRPSRASALRGLGAALLLTVGWLPSFVSNTLHYLDNPWYRPADPTAWWIITDGWPGLVGLGIWLLTRRMAWRALSPGLAVLAALVALEALGLGVEVRKTGIVVLPLLLAGAGAAEAEGRAWLGQLALVLGLGLSSVQIDDRPDLRQAADALAALGGHVPVVAVFASETAFYLRTPAPLPSRIEPAEIATRVAEALAAQGGPCLAAISLPGTFPDASTLPDGLQTIATATITGLDLRLLGHEPCKTFYQGAISLKQGSSASATIWWPASVQ